jgi:hypothetical protein
MENLLVAICAVPSYGIGTPPGEDIVLRPFPSAIAVMTSLAVALVLVVPVRAHQTAATRATMV